MTHKKIPFLTGLLLSLGMIIQPQGQVQSPTQMQTQSQTQVQRPIPLQEQVHTPGIHPSRYWQGKERILRYTPDGEAFVITNGNKRFTRAIYGTNTGFRFETSDFPEFGLYMPGFGGSVYMAVSTPLATVWINELESIESRFLSGQRDYTIKDTRLFGKGSLKISAVARSDGDGLVVRYEPTNLPEGVSILWVYGGASNSRFSRSGDLGADPEDRFFIHAANCENNRFEITENQFTLSYGRTTQLNSAPTQTNPPDTLQVTGTFPTGTIIRQADGNRIQSLHDLLKSIPNEPAERTGSTKSTKPTKSEESAGLPQSFERSGSFERPVDDVKHERILQPTGSAEHARSFERPVIIAEYRLSSVPFYIELHNPKSLPEAAYATLPKAFDDGVAFRTRIASTLKLNTPDPFINTLGGIFSGAEDAVWEAPGYLHGAIGWRVPLTGWRAAYLGDLLGLHERARTHFDGYIHSQVTHVLVTLPPTMDTTLNLARPAKIWGTPMYSTGYICRSPNQTGVMHHYDMNLVFIDELLWHLNWTGDMDYARTVFPVLQRHLAWEKRAFDPDNDGLYDAVCCIWASDALQYNGGKATHSTAYNYRANKMTAEIAKKLGEDATPYEEEAALILSAINRELWIQDKGWWAEFIDNMGNRMRHDNAALWSIYHAIDSDIHDPFKAYQATRYIDTELPHIPVVAKGLNDTTNYMVATTNWQPYMWSINNVAFAEMAHTTLAYWQTGRHNEAFRMFKGAILDAMYFGSGPGNITQVSYYDAARGEMYRDFADPVAMGVRAVVQGMYGIIPDLMNNRLTIKPGFPDNWDFAEIETKNIKYTFKREGNTEKYTIEPHLRSKHTPDHPINQNNTPQTNPNAANSSHENVLLSMEINALTDKLKSITVNGQAITYEPVSDAVSCPRIRFEAGAAEKYDISIVWEGHRFTKEQVSTVIANGAPLKLKLPAKSDTKYGAIFQAQSDKKTQAPNTVLAITASAPIYDPQGILTNATIQNGVLSGKVTAQEGHRTLFVRASSGEMSYWLPVDINVVKPVDISNNPDAEALTFDIVNNTDKLLSGSLFINGKETGKKVRIAANSKESYTFSPPAATLGTNKIVIKSGKNDYTLEAINWNIANPAGILYETVDMGGQLNDKVRDIFAYGKYLTPRYEYTTLQVPTQGMGEWCRPTDLSPIDDNGLRNIAATNNNRFTMPQGIPFATPGGSNDNNIAFTTLWDNYPTQLNIPLNGKASKAYFLVAGSTYHMQSHVLNGQICVRYKDGTKDILDLILPDNLLPLDQDIFIDGWAFNSPLPRPWRVRLKTGDVSKYHAGELGIKMSNFPLYIDGGMATLLDLPLHPEKELDTLTLETIANEVVIGLMGITLVR